MCECVSVCECDSSNVPCDFSGTIEPCTARQTPSNAITLLYVMADRSKGDLFMLLRVSRKHHRCCLREKETQRNCELSP